MKCVHFWTIDSRGEGQCTRCGAKHQFPQEERVDLSRAFRGPLVLKDSRVDPRYWQLGSIPAGASSMIVLDE